MTVACNPIEPMAVAWLFVWLQPRVASDDLHGRIALW